MEKIQTQYVSESFYVYLGEDMTKDALLLLINPGSVDEEEKVCSDKEFNEFHRDRYLNWKRNEYFKEKGLLKNFIQMVVNA